MLLPGDEFPIAEEVQLMVPTLATKRAHRSVPAPVLSRATVPTDVPTDVPAAVPTAVPDTVACPECGRDAVVEWRDLVDSTDGPVEHVKVRCPGRHWFLMPAEALER